MTRYVAFLRAINVGGHTVKMADLKRLFEELGFTNVETFIASGNVIFDSPGRSAAILEGKIEAHLQTALGYEVATFLRTVPEVAQAAAHKPFAADETGTRETLYITFLRAEPAADLQHKLMAFRNAVDDFHTNGREVYWLRRGEPSESTFSGAQLERTLRCQGTARNVTTVRKIAEKYRGDGH